MNRAFLTFLLSMPGCRDAGMPIVARGAPVIAGSRLANAEPPSRRAAGRAAVMSHEFFSCMP
ncbi:hypothetical protein A33K_12885 [Burkholderia humptydooensis MSMB43]|uniref:Lipoprotein n=1 Tax=Burkholderia humptydooensis MSMB43 TaxID=441157 RepID=A0ABN0GAQ4_9BURK|nr:hypothetical protein A33K_12885 [Burkholderia humptydooensis MSMB43]